MTYVDEEYPGRVSVDAQDSVILKYLLRRDAGPWHCTIFDAGAMSVVDGGVGGKRGGRVNETAVITVKIDYTFFHDGVTSMMVTFV